jgi:hypothetical protein
MPSSRSGKLDPEANYLDLVPHHAVDAEIDDDGRVRVLMPRYRDPIFGRLLQPRLKGDRRFIRVPLDPRGSWVWQQVDGQRTVGAIARAFREAFPEEDGAIEERVSRFVAAMVGNGFLKI